VLDWRVLNLLQPSFYLPAQQQQQEQQAGPHSASPLAAVSQHCMPPAANVDLLDHVNTLCLEQQNAEAELLSEEQVSMYIPLLRYINVPQQKPWGPTGSAEAGSEDAAAVRAALDGLAAKLRVKEMQQMYATLGR